MRLGGYGLRSLGIALILAIPPAAAASPPDEPPPGDAKLDPWLLGRLERADRDSFIVLFDRSDSLHRALEAVEGAPERARPVYDLLRSRARAHQAGARAWLDRLGIPYRPLYIVNALQVTGDLALARAIAARSEVARIVGDPPVRGVEAGAIDPFRACGIPYGIAQIHADEVWTTDGARGEGVVVASADTGVQWDHPALLRSYRGWDGEAAAHDFNWHDAVEDRAVPLDDYGHGTHTTGTMVGEDPAAGERIGVAPGARWIACRNMNRGVGRPSLYIECNQFFLAPYPHGGDPETDGDPSRAPDIVNNSWGCPTSEGCDPLTLQDSFAALRAAGILAVASAGNDGPYCSTVTDPPAIYEESFVLGATDADGALADFSSRGPVTVDGSGRTRPDAVAPGVGTCSSVPRSRYGSMSGTSMASPHAAGAAALLWSARPQLRNLVGITRCVMTRSSDPLVRSRYPVSCGGTSVLERPNPMFGWGQIDAFAAIRLGPDADADGVPDPCDCAPHNGGAYDPPGEVRGMRHDADKITLRWDSMAREAGVATAYDLVRGALADLPTAAGIGRAECLAGRSAATSFEDDGTPARGEGYYYLARARNACGDGGWGAGPAGVSREHRKCP